MKNESLSLYREITDYGRSCKDNDITDKNGIFIDTYNKSTIMISSIL